MQSWFLKRGYPKGLADKKLGNVKFSSKVGSEQENEKGVPFVITYQPISKNIGNIIRKNLYFLCVNKETKTIFTPEPIFFFHRARKLSIYLVRAKLYPIKRTVKKCQTCLNCRKNK